MVEDWLTGGDGVNDTTFLATDTWLASIAVAHLPASSSTLVVDSGVRLSWGAVEEMRREAAAQGFLDTASAAEAAGR